MSKRFGRMAQDSETRDADIRPVQKDEPLAPWEAQLLSLLSPRRIHALPAIWRYVLALFMVIAAVALRKALVPVLGTTSPYGIVVATQLVAVILLGIGPGLMAVVLGDVAVEVFILGSLPTILEGHALPRLAVALAVGAFIVWLLHAIRASAARVRRATELRQVKDRLEEIIAERTEALRESEARYKALVESAPVGIFEIDLVNEKFLSVNDAMIAETGYSRDEFLSIAPLDLLDAEHKSQFRDRVRRMMAGEKVPENVEYKVRKKSGETRWALLNANFGLVNGIPVMARVTATDVTERKESEGALRRAEETVRRARDLQAAILDNTHVLIACLDRDFNFVAVNEVYARADGREPDFFIGRNHFALYPNAENEAIFRRVVETGDPHFADAKPFEYAEHPGRGVGCWDWSLKPVQDAGGRVEMLVLTLLDVTSRVRAEEAIRLSEQKFATTFHSNASAMVLTRVDDGRVVDANEAWLRLVGRPREEIIGKTAREHGIWKDPADREKMIRDLKSAGSIRDLEVVCLDRGGGEHTVLISGQTVTMQGEPLLLTSAVEITARKRAEEALQRSRSLLQTILDNTPDAVFLKDNDSRLLLANPATLAVIGKPAEAVIGKTDAEFYNDAAAGRTIMENDRRIMASGRMEVVEENFTDAKGTHVYLSTKAPYRDSEGRVIGLIGVTRDITERKLAEQNLARDLEAMTRLQKLGALSVQEGNLEPVLTEIVDTAMAISGADFGNLQLLDQASGDLRIAAQHGFPPWWLEFWNSVAKGEGVCGTALERGERVIVEDVEQSPVFSGKPALDIQRRAGVRAVQSTPLISRSGKPVGMFSTHYRAPGRPDGHALRLLDLLARQAADIIEHAEVQAALRRSREDLDRAQAVGQIGWWRLDTRRNVLTWSDENHRIFGVPKGTPLSYEAFLATVHPDDREYVDTRWKAGLRGEPYDIEHRIATEGEVKWVREKAYLEIDREGQLLGGFGITQDITELMTTQAALRESEERFRTLNETAPIGVGVSSADGVLLYTNPAYESMLGYDRGELLGRKASDLYVNSDDKTSWLREMKEGREAKGFEAQLRRKDGPPVWVSINTADICYGGKQAVMGTIQDITERRRAEELRRALAEQENLRLGAAVEQASEAVVMIDLDGTIRYVNAAFESINRITRQEAIGTSYFDLLAGEPGAMEAARAAVAAGRLWHRPSTRAVREARPVELEVTGSPAKDPSGTVIGGLITEKDVTRENALQVQFRQAQKMEALGTLAGGITHDFNNILGTIVLNTELALLDLDPADPARQTLPLVLRAANRGKELVKQIITFSRQRTWERKPLEIVPIVKESLGLLRTTLPKDVAIQETLDTRSGVVMADPSHVHQVLVNLCQNAALAMKDGGGCLAVKLAPVEVDEPMAARHPNLKPGLYALLTISDTGCGMTREIRERIFEPFFTTRPPGEGSGLGLAVVHGIVRTYDGEITVYSEPGKGSTFSVYLPRLAGEKPAPEARGRAEPQGGDERILLVEDEKTQRESLERGLGRLGYRVTARADGRSALTAFKRDPSAFDLVITDQVMPRMTGLELAAAISALRPDIPVLLCTGFSEKVDGGVVGQRGVRDFIMKPYTIRELTACIRRVVSPK